MRLVTWTDGSDDRPGVVRDDLIYDLERLAPSIHELIVQGVSADEVFAHIESADPAAHALGSVELRAPLPRPARNVFCLGMNYAEHVAESATDETVTPDLPKLPVWFTKATTSIAGPYERLELDFGVSAAFDWEVELAVIIGRVGRRIPRHRALDHVHSYSVFNDISMRDVQMRHGGQWFKGKSLDRSSPLGPWLVTADEIPDPQNLEISCFVNEVEKQRANTSTMLFDVATAIADISEVVSLEPGDVIATGTPSGIGAGRRPPEYLRAGDVLRTSIAGIGTLENLVTARELAPVR